MRTRIICRQQMKEVVKKEVVVLLLIKKKVIIKNQPEPNVIQIIQKIVACRMCCMLEVTQVRMIGRKVCLIWSRKKMGQVFFVFEHKK